MKIQSVYWTVAILLFALTSSCSTNKEQDLFLIKYGNQFGFINKEGDIVITPQFDDAQPFNKADIAPVMIDGKWGYIDKNGEIIVAAQYDFAEEFKGNALARIKQNDLWGYINEKGFVVSSPQYLFANKYSEGLAVVICADSTTIEIIDSSGNKKGFQYKIYNHFVSGQYDGYSYFFADSILRIKDIHPYRSSQGDTIGMYSRVLLINHDYHIIGWSDTFKWKDGIDSSIYTDEISTFLNSENCDIEGVKFQSLQSFFSSDGIAVKEKSKWGLINTEGRKIVDTEWDSCTNYYQDGLAFVEKNNKWGVFNKKGQLVLNTIYDDVESVSDNIIAVKKNGKWGALDLEGNTLIDFVWDDMGSPCYMVEQNNKWGFLNKNGEIIVNPTYDSYYRWGGI